MFFVCFPSKQKATNVFPKHILKLEACDQLIQARKKLFCCMMVKNYLRNILFKFLINTEGMWRCEINEKTSQLTLLYCGTTVRSCHLRCSIKKLFSKKFTVFRGKHLCWGLFLITLQAFWSATFLKRDSNPGYSCGYCKIFQTSYFEKHLPTAAS